MKRKLVSWNVNGIRATAKKGFVETFKELNTDVLCLQETKAPIEEVLKVVEPIGDYSAYINSSKNRKGYSGTCILSKEEPIDEIQDIGIYNHDQEGRVLSLEFSDYYLVNVYTPNSGSELARLDYRQGWNIDFKNFLLSLNRQKPVIVCGDFNVAHQAIDLANPKSNYNTTAGYTQIEIDGFTNLLEAGFIDTYRFLYPEEIKYSYWSWRLNAREKNVGWRIDYFLVNESLKDKIIDAKIYNEVEGSDHCPVSLEIEL